MSKISWTVIAATGAMFVLNVWTGSKIGVPEAVILLFIAAIVWRVWSFFSALTSALRRHKT